MADRFVRCWRERGSTVSRRERVVEVAAAAFPVEARSCVRLQSEWRAYVAREWRRRLLEASRTIERRQRGLTARARAARAREQKSERRRRALRHLRAAIIQRTFRGFYSRKYEHNFAQRRAYIQAVLQTGEDLRVATEKQLRDEARGREEAALRAKLEKFESAAKRLHYLASTKAIPGVFNSPYLPTKTVNGIPVEQHLSQGVKDLQCLSDLSKSNDLPKDALRAWRPDTRSLQASGSAYDAENTDKRIARKLERASFIGAADLVAGQRVHHQPLQNSLATTKTATKTAKTDSASSCPAEAAKAHDDTKQEKRRKKKRPYFHSRIGPKDSFDAILALERDRLAAKVA